MPVESGVVVPYEWIVPGAYAKYEGEPFPWLFYPNHTCVYFHNPDKMDEVFLEWTVVNRTGDVVQLNLTFFVEGAAVLYGYESHNSGIVQIPIIFCEKNFE